jgi:hypothetical protein
VGQEEVEVNLRWLTERLIEGWKLRRLLIELAHAEEKRQRDRIDPITGRLFDYCESHELLQPVLRQYGATREHLRCAYEMLVMGGAGVWVRGCYVAAGTFLHLVTVEYALRRMLQEPPSAERDQSVAARLIQYFARRERADAWIDPPSSWPPLRRSRAQ